MNSYSSDSNPWLKCLNPKPNSVFRLFCFPPAGSGALFFRNWMLSNTFSEAEIYALCMPGRENRLKEPPLTSMESLIEVLLPNLVNYLDKPFLMFGHSLGAIIAFELTLKMQNQNFPLPIKLFVSARQAPGIQPSKDRLHLLSDTALKRELRSYRGTPESVLNNKCLMELFLPIIRADLRLNETYSFNDKIRVRCPISGFAGESDPMISVSDVGRWKELTTKEFRLYTYTGGHFPSLYESGSILDTIRSEIIGSL